MIFGLNPENEWCQWILKHGLDQELHKIKSSIDKKRLMGLQIFPPENNILKALDLTPFDRVKVVIIGQDPYHGYGQANGLAFSVNEGISIPPSLKNIFQEIERDIPATEHKNGNLENWAQQGVFLINTILTVEDGKPLSHINLGWELFTNAVINRLLKDIKPKVFMLWGKKAQKLVIDNQKIPDHMFLQSSHPSPLSVYRGFSGCSHFSKANEFLIQKGIPPIDWSLR